MLRMLRTPEQVKKRVYQLLQVHGALHTSEIISLLYGEVTVYMRMSREVLGSTLAKDRQGRFKNRYKLDRNREALWEAVI